jgi:PAS domain S-box-containing protein
VLPDPDRTPLDQDVLREIVEGIATETGEQFFDALVRHLAAALHTKCAWITEWLREERRLSALSLWVEDKHVSEYVYDVAGTPCEPVIDDRKLIHVPDRVIEIFPDDPDLEPLGAVSYLGVPLLDTDGAVLGHLAVLDDEPLPEDPRKTAIFNIFAGRAAAELRRVRRDRAIREREEKLSRLIDSAMDAIIELDSELSITRMNSAAEKLFACVAADGIGKPFHGFFTEESCGRLTYLIAELGRQPEGRQFTWIPDGIDAVGVGGEFFPAEATVSRFEMNSRSFYTLILRNVNERLEAQERIRTLIDQTAYLREEIDALQGFDEIIGESDALRRVLGDIEQVATSEATVLITGETGTGKELVARAIHERSGRRKHPLVKVNCAAIAANLQESEFFGHEKGAFTGATQRREGRFKLADGGTIFLDEVGELPAALQAKLLRVLQEGEFERVGSSSTEKVDVRVIAATNRDLEAMVEEGEFRKDLLYRLNVFPIEVPPLRDRGDDVMLLAEAFVRKFARRSGGASSRLSEDDKARLRRYDWPGNVRELENVIERAFITSRAGRLNLERALPEAMTRGSVSPEANRDPLSCDRILTATEMQDFERANILRALEASQWKISGAGGAAERLALNANTLSSRMKSLGIERPPRA